MSRFQPCTTQNSLHTGTFDNTPAPQPTSESTPTPMSSAQPKSRQQPFNFDHQPDPQPDETQVNPPSNADALVRAIDKIVKSNLPNKVKLWDLDVQIQI